MRLRERAVKLKFNTRAEPREWAYCSLCDQYVKDTQRMILVELGPYHMCQGCYEQITSINIGK